MCGSLGSGEREWRNGPEKSGDTTFFKNSILRRNTTWQISLEGSSSSFSENENEKNGLPLWCL